MKRDEAMRLYLDKLDSDIAKHPLASEPVRQSFEVIERLGEKNVEPIAQELRERNLPSLDELGKLQLRHGFSWNRLHRKRTKMQQKLHRST